MTQNSDITAKSLPEIIVPTPEEQAKADKNYPQAAAHPLGAKFLNREISWLRFNHRVLSEARVPANPLLERVKFLSISASNLEEFFMVRVAGLHDQIARGIQSLSEDGQTASEQIAPLLKLARKMMDEQQECWIDLMHGLEKEHIKVVAAEELTLIEKKWVESYFLANIFPTLTPIAIDPAHPFPFLPNKSLTAIYTLEDDTAIARMTALILLPAKLPRFIRLSGSAARVIALEDVLDSFLPNFFPGYHAVESGFFQVLRDSDLAISDEAEDLVKY